MIELKSWTEMQTMNRCNAIVLDILHRLEEKIAAGVTTADLDRMADEWTIGRLLAWTTDYLKEHGSESPRLEAEVLLAHARGSSRVDLYTSFEEPADEALRTKFRGLVKQRAEGVPVRTWSVTASSIHSTFA